MVRHLDRLILVTHSRHRGERAERLLDEGRHADIAAGEHGGLEEEPAARRASPAGAQLGTARHRLAQLAFDALPQVRAREWTHLRLLGGRIADADGTRPFHEALLELVGHGVHHDEALGADAALAGVLKSRTRTHLRGGVDVGVLEHDERV